MALRGGVVDLDAAQVRAGCFQLQAQSVQAGAEHDHLGAAGVDGGLCVPAQDLFAQREVQADAGQRGPLEQRAQAPEPGLAKQPGQPRIR
jgi:hypothetical protein